MIDTLQSKARDRAAGFTLIEVLVVVAIIAILAGYVALNIMDEPEKARVAKAKADIQALEAALQMYKLDNHRYPTTDLGLEALVQPPPDAVNWKQGGYVTALKKDPWGQPYQYLNPGVNGPIDIYSLGADGQPGGEGFDADIGNWETK